MGHEIGVFSITNKDDPKYWTEGNYDTWLGEMAGARLVQMELTVYCTGQCLHSNITILQQNINIFITVITVVFRKCKTLFIEIPCK